MSKFEEFCFSTEVPSFLRMKRTETLHLDIYIFLSVLLILLVVESVFPLLQFPHTSLNSVQFSNAFETVCFIYSHYQPYWECLTASRKMLKHEHNFLQCLTQARKITTNFQRLIYLHKIYSIIPVLFNDFSFVSIPSILFSSFTGLPLINLPVCDNYTCLVIYCSRCHKNIYLF